MYTREQADFVIYVITIRNKNKLKALYDNTKLKPNNRYGVVVRLKVQDHEHLIIFVRIFFKLVK